SPAHSEIPSTTPRMLASSKFRFVFIVSLHLFFFRGPGPIVGQQRRVMAPTFAPAASYLNARRVNLQVIPGSFGNLLAMGGLHRAREALPFVLATGMVNSVHLESS